MLQNRRWTDPKAEAEFWACMERLDAVQARVSAMGWWRSIPIPGSFGRAALQRDMAAIRSLAGNLVERHTVPDVAAPDRVNAGQDAAPATFASDPLRTLAGMVVTLRQDLVAAPKADEEKMG